MANTITNVKEVGGIVAKLAAKMLADEMQFCKSITKVDEKEFNGKNGYKAGSTIYINKPAQFTAGTSLDITSTVQDVIEQTVALPLDVSSTVGVELDSLELAYEIDIKSLAERVIKPAVSSIAQDVENRLLEKATDAVFNSVGTAGSNTFAPDDILAAREKLGKFLCPKDNNRYFLCDSTASRAAVNARKGLFQSSSEIEKQYKNGLIGRADGFTWLENELLNVHTNGNDVTGVAVDGAVSTQGSTTIHVDGLTTTTGTVKKGQVFTVAGVYAVHPITKQVTSNLQQFVVTADVTADGTGDADLSVSPAMYTTGSRQNIDAFPANDAAITFVGAASTAYTQNLAFHKDAFYMASVPLILPENAELAAQETYDGITVAIIRDFDVKTRSMITRLDFLGGIVAVRPEWACRVTA